MANGISADLSDHDPRAGRRGATQSGLRARNERLVLTLLRHHGALPKAEIARRTGLSAQAVSVIMRGLEADGLIVRGEKLRGKVGQPSVPMQLAPDGALFLGLKVGRRSADLVLVDFLGRIRDRVHDTYRFPTPDGTMRFVQHASAQLLGRLDPALRDRVAGLGIAIPYFLWEWASVIGVEQGAMDAWRHRDLRHEIAALFDFPVYQENDATCACGAELVFGAGDPPADFLYVYMGYFIGGGIVLNGHLFTGPSGNAGALGPLPMPGRDAPGGQLVDHASLIGLERRIVEAGGDAGDLWQSPDEWALPDAMIGGWLDQAVPAISHAIVSAVSVIDFEHILIDGWMPRALLGRLVAAVQADLDGRVMSGLRCPQIRAGRVGADARALGAASLPLSRRYMLQA
ncbi:MAG: ROK family transcriptional regulator [Marinibacterium sp.]|nr:ROK family transcriptional regulator [Marinibacterium sp.]